ncbi:GNAT family N-acetyltransferase [Mycoplasmatota bacterium]|nr:GNAT family N-acetyltransferase [Mycoplasmatota bacterium]
MIIRKLNEIEYSLAVELRINFWDEVVAGTVPNPMVKNKELRSMIEWVNTADEHNDIRLLYGAFDNENFMGFAGASIAEESDSQNGIELNYLFVKEEYRGKGVSLKLLIKLLSEFMTDKFTELVVYNFNCSPSNKYYCKLGGKVKKQAAQINGKLLVDIFSFDIGNLNERLKKMVIDRYTSKPYENE